MPEHEPLEDDVQPIAVRATRPVWALISGLLGLVVVGGGGWLRYVQAQQDTVASDVKELQRDNAHSDNRLMRIETKVEAIETTQHEMKQVMENNQNEMKQAQRRIEDKLDQVLQSRGASR